MRAQPLRWFQVGRARASDGDPATAILPASSASAHSMRPGVGFREEGGVRCHDQVFVEAGGGSEQTSVRSASNRIQSCSAFLGLSGKSNLTVTR